MTDRDIDSQVDELMDRIREAEGAVEDLERKLRRAQDERLDVVHGERDGDEDEINDRIEGLEADIERAEATEARIRAELDALLGA